MVTHLVSTPDDFATLSTDVCDFVLCLCILLQSVSVYCSYTLFLYAVPLYAVATTHTTPPPTPPSTGTTQQQQQPFTPTTHTAYYGHIIDPRSNHVLDEVLLLPMRAPRSYTAEDVVEVHCHGGGVCAQRIMNALLTEGVRLAKVCRNFFFTTSHILT